MDIDLRSDTVTRPTPTMMKAIINAEVGDDVYKEDPSVNHLEKKLAQMFGMDQALFFPSGTMANQTAIKLHTHPGDQLIADKWAHIYNFEGGGVSFNSGVSCKLIDGNRGMITAAQVEENINPPDFYHSPTTRLVCLENTTNKGGGACYDFAEIKKIERVCKAHGLGIHLDGARIWNALIETEAKPEDYGQVFDTISVCLSKGLGAPMGSVLMGNHEIMQKAIRMRKVLGGGMRQIGFMAAAGIYALNNHIERLAEDHKRALELSKTLEKQFYVEKVAPTETNIVIFSLTKGVSEAEFLKLLVQKNIKISTIGQGMLRIVTHLDYTEEMHQNFMEILTEINLKPSIF